MTECIFCKIIEGTIPAQIITQTDSLIVIKDIAPKAPTHYLIIPKKHIVDLREFSHEDLELGTKIISVAQQLSRDLNNCPFKLVISNGHEAGQRVFHLHAHFLAWPPLK
jgi:histidine triad (HIT) family protein